MEASERQQRQQQRVEQMARAAEANDLLAAGAMEGFSAEDRKAMMDEAVDSGRYPVLPSLAALCEDLGVEAIVLLAWIQHRCQQTIESSGDQILVAAYEAFPDWWKGGKEQRDAVLTAMMKSGFDTGFMDGYLTRIREEEREREEADAETST